MATVNRLQLRTRLAGHVTGRPRLRIAATAAPGNDPVIHTTLRSLDSLITSAVENQQAGTTHPDDAPHASQRIDETLRDLQAAGLLYMTLPGVRIRQPKVGVTHLVWQLEVC
jgi:hypothetical protein